MKISKILLVLIISSLFGLLFAQQSEMCGVGSLSETERQTLLEIQNNWLSKNNRGFTENITIPIAFHIVHHNGIGNVTDSVIQNQLNVLNTTYSNTLFNFSIHSIDRVNNSVWSMHSGSGSDESLEMRQSLTINPTEILNFYICDQEYPTGYATYPWMYQNEPWQNCVVVKYTILPGGTHQYWNQGKGGTHEVGHFLGLIHPFEGGCDSNSVDDLVSDTPKQMHANEKFCYPVDSCPLDPGLDNIHNYMDYSPDDCKYEFTPGQIERIHQQMLMYRPTMLGVQNGVYVSQLRESGSLMSGSKIYHYKNSTSLFEEYLIPAPYFDLEPDAIETFRGSQELVYNPVEKFYIWKEGENDYGIINHNQFWINEGHNFFTSQFKKSYAGIAIKNNIDGFNVGTIGFKDPWLIDYPDPFYGNTLRNQGMEAPFKQRSSPFYPDYTTSYNGDVYKGVFLNQGLVQGQWQPPYYSVKSESVQDISLTNTGVPSGRNHKFYFQNWSGTNVNFQNPNALETPVVFTQEGATAQANLKGTQISNTTEAYSNNSQRKFLRTSPYPYTASRLHSVYESMGRVWYETSTDNGSTWVVMNQGKPLSNFLSKSPSISPLFDYSQDVLITFHEYYYNNYEDFSRIRVLHYIPELDVVKQDFSPEGFEFIVNSSVNPVIQANQNTIKTHILLVCEIKNDLDPFGGFPDGLYYLLAKLNSSYTAFEWTKNSNGQILAEKINNTDANSYFPCLTQKMDHYEVPTVFHLVWEQKTSTNSSVLRYYKIKAEDNYTVTFPVYNSNLSSGSGFQKNSSPSVIALNNGVIKAVWRGARQTMQEADKTYNKINVLGQWEYKTVYKDFSTGTQKTYGSETNLPTINKLDDNSMFYFAYSEQSDLSGKVILGSDLSTINDLETSGKDVQIGNGVNESKVKANVFKATDLPYYFNLSASMNHVTPKKNVLAILTGREGVVYKDTAQFYFAVGDVIVDNQPVNFRELSDTININTEEALNAFLETETFTLSDNSVFFYSVQYGITDSSASVKVLTDNKFINFKVELIDVLTGSVLGLFDNVTYSENNVFLYNNIAYQVNTTGIGNTQVKLKLVIASSGIFDYSLTERFAEESVLGKSAIKQINLDGSSIVKEYTLEQNYPNPFNPITTIRYALPQDGFVTLKIYDILGSEIATLVNEQKSAGKYEVNFNASSLSSGVYIYKIQSGSFTNSKKMLLLK